MLADILIANSEFGGVSIAMPGKNRWWMLLLVVVCLLVGPLAWSNAAQGTTIHVPGDADTIQGGIDLANDGDTVLVAPGIYQENLVLAGKTITLASHFQTTGEQNLIDSTIIDGNNGLSAIHIANSVGPETTIIGFTIRNADDGLLVEGDINLYNCHITNTTDGVDYEGAGGVNKYNLYDLNSDDAIDLDFPTTILIEENTLINNNDDGIEIRLHDETYAEQQEIIIRNNIITGNGEDGIQFIDYYTLTDRVFTVERNLIANNTMAGIGLMGNANTTENYEGAAITERIQLFNNTIVGNDHGLTGGANLVAVNNIIASSTNIGAKNTSGGSILAYNLFWNNGLDWQNSNLEMATAVFANPLFAADYHLQSGSPAIDAGTAIFNFDGQTVLNIPPEGYAETAPDIGAFEYNFTPPTPTATPSGEDTPDCFLPLIVT